MSEPDIIPIDATVGTENARNGSYEQFLFWLPKKHEVPTSVKREIGLDTAVRVMPALRKVRSVVTDAIKNKPSDYGGQWADCRYTVPDGTTLKLYASRTAWGAVAGKASILLFCSKNAPITRIHLPLSGSQFSTKMEACVTGQFWALNRDNYAEHVEVPTISPQTAHFCSPIFINEVFKIEECCPAPEQAMAKVVKTQVVETKATIHASGSPTDGTVTIRSKKTKRVLG